MGLNVHTSVHTGTFTDNRLCTHRHIHWQSPLYTQAHSLTITSVHTGTFTDNHLCTHRHIHWQSQTSLHGKIWTTNPMVCETLANKHQGPDPLATTPEERCVPISGWANARQQRSALTSVHSPSAPWSSCGRAWHQLAGEGPDQRSLAAPRSPGPETKQGWRFGVETERTTCQDQTALVPPPIPQQS